jgi:hypothetical protein
MKANAKTTMIRPHHTRKKTSTFAPKNHGSMEGLAQDNHHGNRDHVRHDRYRSAKTNFDEAPVSAEFCTTNLIFSSSAWRHPW